MVNVAEDCPPPGAGFVTEMVTEPAVSTSLADTGMVTWLELANEAVREELFHVTVDPERKPDPLTVRVNAALPAGADAGERDCTAGAGLLAGLLLPPPQDTSKTQPQKLTNTFPSPLKHMIAYQ